MRSLLLYLTVCAAKHDPRFAFRLKRPPLNVPNATNAVEAAVSRASSCVPAGTVVLSMANRHHLPLRKQQFKRIQHLDCFMTRVVSICWGNWSDSFGVCVRGDCSGGLGSACLASDFRRSQYVSLNWAKWPFFIDALRVAPQVAERHPEPTRWLACPSYRPPLLQGPTAPAAGPTQGRSLCLPPPQLLWIEADVVISRNPFELLLRLPVAARSASVLYNYEGVPCVRESERRERGLPSASLTGGVACTRTLAGHEEPLNCGQLLINSLQFALEVWAARPAAFYNGNLSQQHYANVLKEKYSHFAMPLEFYNYCWQDHRTTKIVDACQLATYHATCALRATDKLQMMSRFNRASERCEGSSEESYRAAARAPPLVAEWTFK